MKKTHSFPPDVLFLSLQDIAIHLPFGDNSNLFETETDPAVALETRFPSHGAAMILLAVGWAVVVWSDLYSTTHRQFEASEQSRIWLRDRASQGVVQYIGGTELPVRPKIKSVSGLSGAIHLFSYF